MPCVQQRSLDQSQLIHALDFALDFMETVPLDAVLDDPSRYNWVYRSESPSTAFCLGANKLQNSIDQYLLDRPAM